MTPNRFPTCIVQFAFLNLLLILAGCTRPVQIIPDEPNFYYTDSGKVHIDFSNELFYVTLSETDSLKRILAWEALRTTPGIKDISSERAAGLVRLVSGVRGDDIFRAARASGVLLGIVRAAVLNVRHPVFFNDRVIAITDNGSETKRFEVFVKQNSGMITKQSVIGPHTYFVIQVPEGTGTFAFANELYEGGRPLFAQPSFIMHGQWSYVPNDPYYPQQKLTADIHDLERAWDITKGDPRLTVAVFDGPFRLLHPDLEENIVAPYDAEDDDDLPNFESAKDFHGTLVLGLVGADSDNGIGVASTGMHTKVMPVKIGHIVPCFLFGENCVSLSCETIINAGAHVFEHPELNVVAVNNSYTLSSDLDECFEHVLRDIHDHSRNGLGAVILAGTGNDGDLTTFTSPANFDFVIGVGESAAGTRRSAISNFGNLTDLMAEGFLTTTRRTRIGLNDVDDDYFQVGGTSMSTAMVSGITGLIASASMPYATNGGPVDRLERILLQSATPMALEGPLEFKQEGMAGFKNLETGFGLVNAYRAVRMASLTKVTDCIHPILYTKSNNDEQHLYTLDKEVLATDSAVRLSRTRYPELVLRDTLITSVSPDGPFVSVQFQMNGRHYLMRAGGNRVLINEANPVSGVGALVMDMSLPEGQHVSAAGTYSVNTRISDTETNSSEYVVLYDRTTGIERSYKVLFRLNNPLSLRLVNTVQFDHQRQVSYVNRSSQVLVRFSEGTNYFTQLRANDDGILNDGLGVIYLPRGEVPVVWTMYEGVNGKDYLFTQTSRFDYSIREIARNGAILRHENHGLFNADPPFQNVSVMHIYDQGRPLFFFWNDLRNILVKQLKSELELEPLETNRRDLREPGDPNSRDWNSSIMLSFPHLAPPRIYGVVQPPNESVVNGF